MTYATDEGGVETSMPREGIEIATSAVTYRIATGDRDITINGFVFKASPAQRASIPVDVIGAPGSVQITLPVSHPIAQRYLTNGVPPRQVAVTIYRQQETSGGYVQMFTGLVASMAIDGHTARFLIPGRTSDTILRRIPTLTAGSVCPHVLYGPNCRADRASFTIATTVAVEAGHQITVASLGGKPDRWAQNGELVHVASGERMTIGSQVGNVIQMQFPIAELRGGDAVTVSAGCNHMIGPVITSPPTLGFGCKDGFDNVLNFGGQPHLVPTRAYTTGSRGSTDVNKPRRQVP